MLLLTTILTAVLSCSPPQSGITVTKKNGDEIRLSNITVVQSPDVSSDQYISFKSNGKDWTLTLNSIRRINLKSVSSRKKGVPTWEALLVKKDNQKLEVQLDLVRIIGSDSSGGTVEISSNTIDKLSF